MQLTEFVMLLPHLGVLTIPSLRMDLSNRFLPGTRVETTFPIDKAKLGESFLWPPVQIPPFDGPPVDFTNATNNGYSKQAYFFDGGNSSLITVGPSTPKIAP